MARILTLFAFGLLLATCELIAVAGSASTTESHFLFDEEPLSASPASSKRNSNRKAGRGGGKSGSSTAGYRTLPPTTTAIYDQSESHSSGADGDSDTLFDADVTSNADNDAAVRSTSTSRYNYHAACVRAFDSRQILLKRLRRVSGY